jgi:hypothetical protein
MSEAPAWGGVVPTWYVIVIPLVMLYLALQWWLRP